MYVCCRFIYIREMVTFCIFILDGWYNMHVLRKLREENLCLSRIYTSITVTVCNMRYTQVSKMALKWSKMLYLFNLYHQFLLLFYKHQENLRGITLWIVFSHIIHALLYKCKSSFGVVHNLCFDIKKNCCCFYAENIVCLKIKYKTMCMTPCEVKSKSHRLLVQDKKWVIAECDK